MHHACFNSPPTPHCFSLISTTVRCLPPLRTGWTPLTPQNWDGSGGNGAALRHFEATVRRYPLVVKLGTITPHSADVYSYAPDEEDMVTDPLLAQHLAHWGIDIMKVGRERLGWLGGWWEGVG